MSATCPCGSGKERFELRDAAGIFCTFVCDDCEAEKKAKFNPAIFDEAAPYASTGEEADLNIDRDSPEDDEEDDDWQDDRLWPEDEPESPGFYWDEDGRHAY